MARKTKQRRCLLLDMHIDVLRSITDYIPPSSILALRSTCKALWGSLPAEQLRQSDSAFFEQLLLRDGYDVVCAKETWKSGCLSQRLLCSGCKKWHDKMHFSASQRWNPPQTRLCRWTEGVIYLCPHVTLDRKELKALSERLSNKSIRYWILCTSHGPPRPSCGCLAARDKDSSHLRIVNEIEMFCDNGRGGSMLQPKQLGWITDLYGNGIYLCPHGRWKDIFLGLGQPNNPNDSLWKCKQKDCETDVLIRQSQESFQGGITLRINIERRLGFVDDALDPQWLSQTKPKPKPRSFISSFGLVVAVLVVISLADS